MKIQKGRSVEKIVEEQIQQWEMRKPKKVEKPGISVITVSRQPGSEGNEIAAELAESFGYNLFDQEIIHAISRDAKISDRVLETLDEKGLNVLEDVLATVIEQRHLWPDQYMKHLMKVIGTIGRHGKAVIVGRGGNFILPENQNLRLRIVAPFDRRVNKVAREHDLSITDARRQIYKEEAERRSFTRRYFYADIDDPIHYDLVINTEHMSTQEVIAVVRAAMEKKS
ncbi:MAG: AAA family ATPase [Thermodesulfobacteriota bacterium]